MKIALLSPLYPPDIGEPAPYVKELAKRLAGRHEITIITYGRSPEKVPGARVVAVNKYYPLPLRLIAYFAALWRNARTADVIYAQNGPSVELPLALAALLSKSPLVMRLGDIPAHEYARRNPLRRLIEKSALGQARRVIADTPLKRPIIWPLEDFPAPALAAWNASWNTHLELLENIFKDAAGK